MQVRQHEKCPCNQPFNIKHVKHNLTKTKAWWQRGNNNNGKKP